MKYNYIKFMGIGLIVAVIGLFAIQLDAQTTLKYGDNGVQEFQVAPSHFGDFVEVGDTISGEIAYVTNSSGQLDTACTAITQDLTDKIAIILRGSCTYTDKITNAADAGAKAVVIVNTEKRTDGPLIWMSNPDDVSAPPAFMMGLGSFQNLAASGFEGEVEIFYDYPINANVIWGDEEGEGDFANGFQGWTTNGITDTAFKWTYEPDAQIDFRFMVDSRTKGNGAAGFDAVAYNNLDGGVNIEEDIAGELISPVIDLSGESNLSIKWTQVSVGFRGDGTGPVNTAVGLYYSTNGGEDWSERIDVPVKSNLTAGSSDITNPETVLVPLFGVQGTDEFRFKVEYRDDVYGIVADDFEVIETPSTNIVADGDPFYTPVNYNQPTYSIKNDTFFFQASFANNGAEQQENMDLRVEIIDVLNGQIVETITGETDTILPIDGSATVELDTNYVPTDLEPSDYIARYTLIPDGQDFDPSDNSSTINFSVSENTYSMSPSKVVSGWGLSEGQGYGHANVYSIPAEVQEEYIIDYVETTFANSQDLSGDALDGLVVSVLFSALPDTLTALGNLPTDGSQAPLNLSSTDRIAFQDLELTANSQEGDPLIAEGDNFINADDFITQLDEVDVEPGKQYLVWAYKEEGDFDLPVNGSQPILRTFTPLIYAETDESYFGRYTSGSQALIELNLKLKTTSDVSPLPEESMTVYPNPVAGSQIQAELDFDQPTTATITVADMNGSVHSFNTYKNVTNQTVREDVSNLPAGTYLMRLATKDGSRTVKFIKQ